MFSVVLFPFVHWDFQYYHEMGKANFVLLLIRYMFAQANMCSVSGSDYEIVDGRYKCPYVDCEWMFSKTHHVTAHLLIHKGLMPFICAVDDCGKAHRTLSSYKTHARKIHKKQEQGNV